LPTVGLLGAALCWFAPFAVAQTNLGQLLDAGAKKLSGEEFREELLQRVLVGPTASGGNAEFMYVKGGGVVGRGSNPLFTGIVASEFSGEWKIEEGGKFCSTMRMPGAWNSAAGLPTRCQFWFKYEKQYFLADSDTDRQARVLRRTVKQ